LQPETLPPSGQSRVRGRYLQKGSAMNRFFIASLFAAVAATAALLAPTSASAEILLKGEAKMGLVFDGQDIQAVAGARITAHVYGVTDGGLEYGAVIHMEPLQPLSHRSPFNDDDDNRGGYVYMQSGNHSLRLGGGAGNADATPGGFPKTSF
jgi:hypothetical protein